MRIRVIPVGLAALTACFAAGDPSLVGFDPLLYQRHTRSGPLLQLHWNLHQTGQGTTAEGYAENVGHSLTRLKWIRLQLVGYDGQGKELVRSRAVPPRPAMLVTRDNPTFPLDRDVYAIFRIHLPDPQGAVHFEVLGQYFSDTFPQGEGDANRKKKKPH